MRLILFRHGPAEARENYRGGGDASRPLTAEGRSKTRDAARGLKRQLDDVSDIVTSPYQRARETADILASVFDVSVAELAGLAPGDESAQLETWLAERPPDTVAIAVGHEPGLGDAASWFLSGRAAGFAPLKKAGVIVLDFTEKPTGGNASLHFAMTGKQLRRAGS